MSHLSLTIGMLVTVAQTLAAPSPPSPRVDAAKTVVPRIVCGMVVVPVDAGVDRRMVVQPPSGVSFTVKVIVPPVCVD